MESKICVSCEKDLPVTMYDCSGSKNDSRKYELG